jgi:2-keto-4-pentenoate hydratase/2-oxohepta-3-ene-1,7-dioic acid hydratase in catechol pathway
MRIVRFSQNEEIGFGVIDVEKNMIYSNHDLMKVVTYEELIGLIAELNTKDLFASELYVGKFTSEFVPDSVKLLAPVVPTKNILCIGKNYYDHVLEFDGSLDDIERIKENPIFFSKALSSIIGPEDEIDPHTEVTKSLDYEAELGVIIGKTCKNVSYEEALDYVFGYTIINDVTARDVQKRHQQWFLGKSFDTFCPIGPWVVTADEIGNPNDLAITLDVNKERRQESNTSLMIHDIAKQISILSKGMTLNPGDVIATGTPKGVGIGYEPPRYLASQDVVTININKIGTLTNKIK